MSALFWKESVIHRLWILLAAVCGLEFAVLGWLGTRIYQDMPPIPDRVVTSDGREVVAAGEIARGQAVWQTLGGMDVGSIWGHGAYVAPDWTADWLHHECVFALEMWAVERGANSYADLAPEDQAALRERLARTFTTNGYDARTGMLVIAPVRAAAFEDNAKRTADVFSRGRAEYAIPAGAVTDPARCASSPRSSSGRRGPRPRTVPATTPAIQATGPTSRCSDAVPPPTQSCGRASA